MPVKSATVEQSIVSGEMRMTVPSDHDLTKILDSAPVLTCLRCSVGMVLRHFDQAGDAGLYTGTYRCPTCGTETQREFKVGEGL